MSVNSCRIRRLVAILLIGLAVSPLSAQTLDKGHRILLERGVQTNGLCNTGDLFHLNTLLACNFSGSLWIWDTTVSLLGPAPGIPWGRWAGSEANMPSGSELAYLDNLVALQLSDENNLNDPAVRAQVAAWYNDVRSQYQDTILYSNSYGGQLTNESLGDFINTSQPDMLSFDTYPFQPGGPPYGSPTNWYGDLQRYRKWGRSTGLPYAIYTQTFHDYMTRDPSESEMRLNYFAGLAFGYTSFTNFTYNTGASSLFDRDGNGVWHGDEEAYRNARYFQLQEINRRVRRLSPAMSRLVNLYYPMEGDTTRDGVYFSPGQHLENGTPANNPTPVDIAPNWLYYTQYNPHLKGIQYVTNLGSKNDGLRGDIWISWFKVLDESFDGPNYNNEIYFMVTNGLTAADGSAADCRQEIQLNFKFDPIPTSSLQHLRQDTGEVEVIQLTPIPNSDNRYKLVMTFDGGTGELFKSNTGAPFVGAMTSTGATLPTLPVSRLTATRGPARLTLKWINAPELDYTGCVIRRKLGSFPTGPTDGTLVADKAGSPGYSDSVVDSGLDWATTYYYAAFAHDGTPAYATATTVSAAPACKADFDTDDDVDQEDFGFFQKCFSGTDPVSSGCSDANLNGVGGVDDADFALFMPCFRGPTAPPGC